MAFASDKTRRPTLPFGTADSDAPNWETMSRYTVVTSFVVAIDRLGDALKQLPGAEQLHGEDSESADAGEVELRMTALRDHPAAPINAREQVLFSDVAWATAALYRAGVPCRLVGWGCHEEPR